MPNTFENTKKVAVGIELLKNKLGIVKDINQKFSKTFAGPESTGDTISLRVPFNASTRSGAVFTPQEFGEQKRNLTINKQEGSDIAFTLKERALDVKEYAERVMRPEMAQLATTIEADVLETIVPVTSNVLALPEAQFDSQVGYEAKARLMENLCPDDRIKLYITPRDQAKIVKGSEALFNPVQAIANQVAKGELDDNFGVRWSPSTLIPRYETGSADRTPGAITVSVNAVNPDKDAANMALVLTGLGATETIKRGEVFTVAGVEAINYATKKTLVQDKQFVVLADAVAVAGTITLSVRPVFDATMNAYQTVTKLPEAGDAITLIGDADKSYSQSFCMTPDAYTVAFAQVKTISSKTNQASYSTDGISMRYWEDDDFVNDGSRSRFDVYYGITDLWEQWAIRVINLG